jgi:hypothetical protein
VVELILIVPPTVVGSTLAALIVVPVKLPTKVVAPKAFVCGTYIKLLLTLCPLLPEVDVVIKGKKQSDDVVVSAVTFTLLAFVAVVAVLAFPSKLPVKVVAIKVFENGIHFKLLLTLCALSPVADVVTKGIKQFVAVVVSAVVVTVVATVAVAAVVAFVAVPVKLPIKVLEAVDDI